MSGMKGFHVSASGATQGHHGPLVFKTFLLQSYLTLSQTSLFLAWLFSEKTPGIAKALTLSCHWRAKTEIFCNISVITENIYLKLEFVPLFRLKTFYSLSSTPQLSPACAALVMCLQFKSFENSVGKGEIACNKQFLSFLPFWRTFHHLRENKVLSANSFGLEQSEICLFGEGSLWLGCMSRDLEVPDWSLTGSTGFFLVVSMGKTLRYLWHLGKTRHVS